MKYLLFTVMLISLILFTFITGCSKSEKGITSFEDAKTAKLGVMTGSTGEAVARKKFPEAQVNSFDDIMDAVAAIKSGQLDAIITLFPAALQVSKKNPELRLLPEALDKEDTAIAIKKGNDDLLASLDRIISELKSDGTLDSMKGRWLKADLSPYEELDIKLPKEGAVLRIGVSATREPFSFVDEHGRVTGHDGELARLIGARLGRPIEFSNMKFMALIPALQSGKIDLIITGMTASAERKKSVNFTQPYFANTQVMIVKKSASATAGAAADSKTALPPFLQSIATSFRSNIILENRYMLILDGLKTTIVISVLATILGTLLGALVCFMRMSKKKLLNLPARVYISILRGTPVLVLLMLIFYVVFASVNISPVLVAVIAFGMNFAAYSAEIFRTGIEGVDRGQTEAGISLGFTKVTTFLNIVLPQTVRRILPVYKGEFISLVKMTSIVGYIAVQDLTKASDIIRSRTFDAFFPLVMVAILYFLISWLLMQSLEYLERKTDPKSKRSKVACA
ncbi:MAG: ABC transporter substrate-binding protein/permease [Geobacteraceae bacterium]|nr:ABC transporter substrate-binding protein/permease [Geobacteraceae bacterium]